MRTGIRIKPPAPTQPALALPRSQRQTTSVPPCLSRPPSPPCLPLPPQALGSPLDSLTARWLHQESCSRRTCHRSSRLACHRRTPRPATPSPLVLFRTTTIRKRSACRFLMAPVSRLWPALRLRLWRCRPRRSRPSERCHRRNWRPALAQAAAGAPCRSPCAPPLRTAPPGPCPRTATRTTRCAPWSRRPCGWTARVTLWF
mmetsp:Transcript_21318/g.50087  ORF Transcript_21318/g.50087 Transcript_21318/m.50087 type:complete len:201 (-) Transcript_21318:576-1178(-)